MYDDLNRAHVDHHQSALRRTDDAQRATHSPRRRSRVQRLLAAGLLALGVGLTAACDTDQAEDLNPALACHRDHGKLYANGSVTNHSSQSSTYLIEIGFAVAGTRVNSSDAYADEVRPGETAPIETSVHAPARDGDVSCWVISVDRFHA